MNQVTLTKSKAAQATAAALPPRSIQDLPPEIREKIFSELSAPEALRARLVCKEWNTIISGDRLWNFFFHRDFKEWERSPSIENATQIDIRKSNIDHGKFNRRVLEGGMQTPILSADGLIIYGNVIPYGHQTIKVLDTRTDDCLTIQINATPDTHLPINFNTLVYAEGFIFAAADRRPLIIGWDAKTGDKTVEIETRGIIDRLVYKDGMFFLSFEDNPSNFENGVWHTVEILDFNPKIEARSERLAEQSTLEAVPECGVQNLPPEIMQIVFSNLRVADASSSRIVCRDWNTLINDNHLWRLFLNRDFGLRESASSIENLREMYILQSNLKNGVHTSLTHTLSDRHSRLCFVENKIIYVAEDNSIKVCDAVTGHFIKTLEWNGKKIEKLVYANGKLLSLSLNNFLTIWDIETGDCIAHEQRYCLAESLTYGDERLFVGHMGGEITIHDLEGHLMHTLQRKKFIHSLSYTDGILCCSYMSDLSEMWDFNHGEAVEQSADDASNQVGDEEQQI